MKSKGSLLQIFLTLCISVVSLSGATGQSAAKPKPPLPAIRYSNGTLSYTYDSLRNRVPDFSYSGYNAGESAIPTVPVRMIVPVIDGDATLLIQTAIDAVSQMPVDKDGIRGAILLQKGLYNINGSLHIKTSGVVLRGSGMGSEGTILFGAGKDRETLITVSGKHDAIYGDTVKIADAYVPVNAVSFSIKEGHSFKPGDLITIQRSSTSEWIKILKMEKFGGDNNWLGWKPAYIDIYWERFVKEVKGNQITIDAPISTAIDENFGGGTVALKRWPGRIVQTGVENLRCRSAYDESNPKDEAHRWMAITINNTMDSWVRQVVFEHFAGSAVYVAATARRVTVEDCKSLSPVSEIAAQRRYTFFTSGQQTLFQRIYAEHGYHDFAVGYCAPGPNVFVQCESHLPFNYSGTVESWASGVLMDIVTIDGHNIGFPDRSSDGQGAGYTGANSVIWQCAAAKIILPRPPTATNWAFGTWARYSGNGDWFSSDTHIQPRSLYYGQLAARLGKEVWSRSYLMPIEGESASRPSAAVAAKMIDDAGRPAVLLKDWIDSVTQMNTISIDKADAMLLRQNAIKQPTKPQLAEAMQIQNGWLVRGNTVFTGARQDVLWWRGNIRPQGLKDATAHITRYVPGTTGTGLTDDLNEVTDAMLKKNVAVMEHNYGLWYDRRRDDHQRVRRADGDVWPPFYELPFERSGQGTAWDGLSKYDLTKYNYWYWNRLRTFADLADEKGLALIHQHYFQHNILEAGAHYADFPWRTANNINHTPFPEPPNYAGDKRIFMSKNFYDTADANYKSLHRAYIRQCLDNFSSNNGVIHLIGAEFTGPLHFVQFWVDVIGEWKKEKGNKAIIGISTNKDVQDAILKDPSRSWVIDLIDIRYWGYNAQGNGDNAPKGGRHLAPRQGGAIGSGGEKQVYKAVLDYRTMYPDKAVICSPGGGGWAVFMAGGSMASLPRIADDRFLKDAAGMQPMLSPVNQENNRVLANAGKGYILYLKDAKARLDLSGVKVNFKGSWIDPAHGALVGKPFVIKGNKVNDFEKPDMGDMVLWVR